MSDKKMLGLLNKIDETLRRSQAAIAESRRLIESSKELLDKELDFSPAKIQLPEEIVNDLKEAGII